MDMAQILAHLVLLRTVMYATIMLLYVTDALRAMLVTAMEDANVQSIIALLVHLMPIKIFSVILVGLAIILLDQLSVKDAYKVVMIVQLESLNHKDNTNAQQHNAGMGIY